MQNFTMRPLRPFAQWAAVFTLAVVLVGCSAIRLGYSNGETVAYWWLNSYVDFESGQQPWVKRQIGQLFDWHRKTQLDDYAQLLTNIQQRLHYKVTSADVTNDYDAIKKRAMTVIEKSIPELTNLALSLQPQQIAQIEKKFEANNEKYRKEFLHGDLEQRQRARYKQVMKHAEYWFGDFNAKQEAQIRVSSDARALGGEAQIHERIRRQQAMIALLKKIQTEKPAHAVAMHMLKDYVAATLDHFGDEKQTLVAEAFTDGTVQLATTIINIATPQQKAHAMRQLQQWIEDCHQMAAK
jgi:hypothetical protein